MVPTRWDQLQRDIYQSYIDDFDFSVKFFNFSEKSKEITNKADFKLQISSLR